MNGVAIATPTATATSGYQPGGTGTIFRAEMPNTAPAGFTGGTVDLYQPVTITQNGTQLTVDDPVQYVAPPTETLTYDADGNLKTDGRWTYTWDAADRLIKMESIAFVQNASPPLVAVNVPAKVIEFAYDGLSRRIRKKVTEGVSTIAVWEAYVYDGWNMVLSVKLNPAAGATQGRPQSAIASYVWAPDLGSQPFARRDWQAAGGVRGLVLANYFTGANGGGIHVPGMDPMGNVTSVTRLGMSYSAGESPGPYFRSEFVYDYDAFGKETRSSTLVAGLNPDSFPFHFSTKFTDGETGFNYYGYRFYDPANGRWINRDPIGEKGGTNLYAMVRNDGVNFVDVLGMVLNVNGDAAYKAKIAKLLQKICPGAEIDTQGKVTINPVVVNKNCPKGCDLLKKAIDSSHTNNISPFGADANNHHPVTNAQDLHDATYEEEPSNSLPDGKPGAGSGSNMFIDPDQKIEERAGPNFPWKPLDPSIGIAHELGHVSDINDGTAYRPVYVEGPPPNKTYIPVHERSAVKVENAIRAEQKLPSRPLPYGDPNKMRFPL